MVFWGWKEIARSIEWQTPFSRQCPVLDATAQCASQCRSGSSNGYGSCAPCQQRFGRDGDGTERGTTTSVGCSIVVERVYGRGWIIGHRVGARSEPRRRGSVCASRRQQHRSSEYSSSRVRSPARDSISLVIYQALSRARTHSLAGALALHDSRTQSNQPQAPHAIFALRLTYLSHPQNRIRIIIVPPASDTRRE